MHRNRRKVLEGTVVSTKMDKTAVVQVVRKLRHKRYGKLVIKRKKFFAHDEENRFKEGDYVKIASCRPFSKFKRWRVIGT